MVRIARTTVRAVALISLLGACTATTAPSSVPSSNPPATTPGPTSTARPASPVPSPTDSSPMPTEAPTPTTAPRATPAPTANADPSAWSDPVRIAGGSCSDRPAVTIDDRGRHHIAAWCDDKIRYVMYSPGAIDQQVDTFSPPRDRLDVGPQLARDGEDTLMAFSRLAVTEGGCGDDGLVDVGVYVRTRSDATGAWSTPIRLSEPDETLQSFRAVDGTLHATVAGPDGHFYVARSGDRTTRVRIPGADATSLRIGDDRRPRVAYTTGEAIRYARIDGDEVVSTEIDTTDGSIALDPALVLAPGDVPTVMWTQDLEAGSGGCASPDSPYDDGTYLATRRAGIWDVARVSTSVGGTSLTLDPRSGLWHAVITDSTTSGNLRYLTGRSVDDRLDGPIPGTADAGGATIRINPADGSLVVVAVDGDEGIDVLTRPGRP